MANLNTKTLAAGVGDILAVADGIDPSTARQIKDGDGTGCPFYITTTLVGIGASTPTALLTVGAINTLVTDGTTAVTPEGMNVHIT